MKFACRCLLFVIGFVLVLLTFSSPLPASAARSLQHAWQLGHILLFAIWTWLLFPALAQRFPRPQLQFIIVILVSLFAGLLIEYLQTFVGRQFSLTDLVYDLIGSLLALSGFVINGTLIFHPWPRRVLHTVTVLLGLYAVAPLAGSLLDEIMMYRNFPLLAGFDRWLEVKRWRGKVEIVTLLSARGNQKVLQVSLNTNHYSGVSLAWFPRDWRGYRRLQFELFNPDNKPLMLTLRIHDALHYRLGKGDYYDRFNRSLQTVPGWNSISVDLSDIAGAPRHRRLDLARVEALGLFSTRLPESRTIYMDDFRLSK